MHNRNKKIENFFGAYESFFNKVLTDENYDSLATISALSSSCFIESNPHIITCGKCDALQERMKENFTRYKNNGLKKATIYSKEVIPLDDYHAMVKVQWHFSSSDDEILVLNIIYLLRTIQKDIKIFGYISGDEQQALKRTEKMSASQEKEMIYDL